MELGFFDQDFQAIMDNSPSDPSEKARNSDEQDAICPIAMALVDVGLYLGYEFIHCVYCRRNYGLEISRNHFCSLPL